MLSYHGPSALLGYAMLCYAMFWCNHGHAVTAPAVGMKGLVLLAVACCVALKHVGDVTTVRSSTFITRLTRLRQSWCSTLNDLR